MTNVEKQIKSLKFLIENNGTLYHFSDEELTDIKNELKNIQK